MLIVRLSTKSSASDRITARLMLFGIALSAGPGIVLAVIPALLKASFPAGLSLYVAIFAIPLLPFSYIYAIYKHRLGDMEFRANRLLGIYGFVLLYVTAVLIVFFWGRQWELSPNASVMFHLIALAVFVIAVEPLRKRFQRFVDRLAYGVEHNPEDIIHVFSRQIPRASSRETLIHLLADELTPSLFIRQSALFY